MVIRINLAVLHYLVIFCVQIVISQGEVLVFQGRLAVFERKQ